MKTKLHICYICAGILVQPLYALWLVGQSLGSQGSRLVDSVGLLVESLSPLASSVLPSTLPQDFLSSVQCWPWVFAHLFCLAAGWSLSEDSSARLLSVSLG